MFTGIFAILCLTRHPFSSDLQSEPAGKLINKTLVKLTSMLFSPRLLAGQSAQKAFSEQQQSYKKIEFQFSCLNQFEIKPNFQEHSAKTSLFTKI